jgi:CheY-like chemotaxis protein
MFGSEPCGSCLVSALIGQYPVSAEKETGPAPDADGRVVLIVDDEAGIVEEMCELLTSRGYRAVGARCVPDALGRLGADRAITLIVTDLSMPGASGLDLIRECRRNPALSSRAFRFVLATGQTELTHSVRAEIEEIGIDLMLKPIRPRELLALLAGDSR